MTEQELLIDSLEREIKKVIQANRNEMYQRMSPEKPSNEGSQIKYMVRYYRENDSLRTKILKPEKGTSIVKLASNFVSKNSTYPHSFWVYDGKRNLIYSQT